MLEILLTLVMAILMAKRTPKRRRSMGGYLKGNIDESLSLGTLASLTLVSDTWDETVVEKTFVSSIVAIWSLSDFTPAIGDGPILVGVAHSDYTDAEIEAVLENTGSWDQGDLVQQETARRLVRIIGKFELEAVAGSTFGGASVLNDGKPIKTKLNWTLVTGQTLRHWAYNLGSSPIATTVPLLKVSGHANLWSR